MRWTLRFEKPGTQAELTRSIATHPGVSHEAFRLYVWLLKHESDSVDFLKIDGVVPNPSMKIAELEALGLVMLNRSGIDSEITIVGPQTEVVDRSGMENVFTIAQAKHHEAAAQVRERRAARVFTREKPQKIERERKVTAHTLYGRWKDAWARAFPKVAMLPWKLSHMSMAKKLIERLGEERSLEYIDKVFDNWTSVVQRHGFRGYPTLEWCLKFLDSYGLELLSGQKIGKNVATRNAREVALNKGEFDASADGEKDVGWDDG